MGSGGSTESAEERSLTSIIEGQAFSKRGWLNIPLFFVIALAWIAILTFYLIFWIENTDLFGSPSIVWSNALWYGPQLFALTIVATMIPFFGIRTHPLEAPTIWMALIAIVATVFNGAAALFYFRLWWQCTLNTGSFTPREDEICDTEYTELSVIAWFGIVFLVHSIVAIFTGFGVYYSDTGRLEEIKEYSGRKLRAAKEKGSSLLSAFQGKEKVDAMIQGNPTMRFRAGAVKQMGLDGRAPAWAAS
jgi:hypothetical protein